MSKKTLLAAGGLVQNPNNEILMIFRRGFWDLPKGKLDPGETIEQCAIREVEEETKLSNIALGKFICITRHEYFDTYLKEDVVKESHWFAMRIRDFQQGSPQEEEDITDIKWVHQKELQRYLKASYPNIQTVINTYLSS